MIEKTNSSKQTSSDSQPVFAELKMNEDLKHSILIVSLIANLFIFTAWIAMQVTTQYDAQIFSLLFTR
jgi:hypothetical protein